MFIVKVFPVINFVKLICEIFALKCYTDGFNNELVIKTLYDACCVFCFQVCKTVSYRVSCK